MAEAQVSTFVSVGETTAGLALHAETWRPAGEASAVLVFIHGLGDHVGRYAEAFRHLVGAGIAVHTFDQVGHGRSPPHPTRGRFNCDRLSDLVADAAAFADAVRLQAPPAAPLLLAGQSLGGLLAAFVALGAQASFDGLLLLSAAVNVPMTLALRVQSAFSPLLTRLAPDAEIVPAVKPEYLSRDEAVVTAFRNDPLVAHAKTKVRIAVEISKGFAALERRYAELVLPLLALHGDADKVTSLAAVRRLVAASRSPDKAFVEVGGAFHELLLDTPCKGDVLAQVVAWVNARAAAKAAAASPEAKL